jgi:hypothetical protein
LNKVLSSIENQAGDHCVDVFVRDDGTFGFEEYRRDPEDARGWFSLQHYSHLLFGTEEEARAEATVKVAWMKEA